jgi:hypothetical protein
MKEKTALQLLEERRCIRNKARKERKRNRELGIFPTDPRLVQLEERVRRLKEEINLETIYAIAVSGHLVYKGGMGLPHEAVVEAIRKGLCDGECISPKDPDR